MASRLHSLLGASAHKHPQRPAFVGRDRVLDYAALERLSGRFAAGLRALGVRKGDRVALLLDADADHLIVYYGIAKVGAAVVPLHSDVRSKSLARALAHSGARAAVLDARNLKYLSGLLGQLPELRCLVCRTPDKAPAQAAPEPDPAPGFTRVSFAELLDGDAELHHGDAEDDDLLSIVYTSGTTGEPKGVMLSHRNLVANVRSIVTYLELAPEDRVAMVLPFHYVYGNSVLHTHVAAGAAIVHLGDVTFPAAALEAMRKQACTGLSGVPATFARLLSVQDGPDAVLSGLRYLTQAGAAMAPALIPRLRARFPAARIYVMYGQTEAAARLSYVPPDELDRKLGSAGKAIPGVRLKVVDAAGREVARGETGEVAAEGDNVMLGYWNDPEATARVLNGGLLRTGDLGRMDEDGFLYLVGRQTEMIKSGGHRIAPQEIEAALATAPGVQECAVVGVPDEVLGEAIAAFIVPQPGAKLEKQKLLAACHAELPRFKLPQHLRSVDELPRTNTGKLTRLELKEWFARGAGTGI